MSHNNATTFENFFVQLEHVHCRLSHWAMYPFIGTLPAAAKVLLGVIEVVVSAIFFILALIPSICSQTARSLLAFSALHIGRGIVRTLVGATLAVPILGLIFICGTDRIAGDCCGIVSLTTDGDSASGEHLGHSIILS